MSPLPGPRALLEIAFVIGASTTNAHSDWSYKVMSGARVHKRSRHTKLAVGVADIRWENDGDQVLMLMKALAQQLDEDDRPKAPASPGGGTTGGDQLGLLDELLGG